MCGAVTARGTEFRREEPLIGFGLWPKPVSAPSADRLRLPFGGSARIARLRVRVSGPLGGVLLDPGTLGEQLDVRVTSLAGCAVHLATLRDSACSGSDSNSEGVIASGDGEVTLRNVTAVGGDNGMQAFAGNANENLVVDAVNSVFSGVDDIFTAPDGAGATARDRHRSIVLALRCLMRRSSCWQSTGGPPPRTAYCRSPPTTLR